MYIIESLIESGLCYFWNSIGPNKNRIWNVYMFKWQRKREVNLKHLEMSGTKKYNSGSENGSPGSQGSLRNSGFLRKDWEKEREKGGLWYHAHLHLHSLWGRSWLVECSWDYITDYFFFYLKKHQNLSEFLCSLHAFNNIHLQVNLPWLLSWKTLCFQEMAEFLRKQINCEASHWWENLGKKLIKVKNWKKSNE